MLACSLVTRTCFFEMRFDLGTLDSGERSLPFGLLVQKSVYEPDDGNLFLDT